MRSGALFLWGCSMNYDEEIGLLKSRVAILEGNAKLALDNEGKFRRRIEVLEQQVKAAGLDKEGVR